MKELYSTPDHVMGVHSAHTLTIDCTKSLGSSETLSGITGTDGFGNALGASVSSSELDFEDPEVNAATITSRRTNETIAIGKAIQIRVIGAGCKPGKEYVVTIVVSTSTGDTLQIRQKVRIV